METPAVSVWAPPARRTGTWLVVLALGAACPSASPARAGGGPDDCAPRTRHARAEYQAEHEHSRHLGHLDCAGLAAYTEGYRQTYNQRVLSTYLRPTATVKPAASSPRVAPPPDTTPPSAPAPRP
jgi:hypothetical protein